MERPNGPRTVVIDCFPERVAAYRQGHAIVAIDVIRATTTAVTAAALGRACYPVPTLTAAFARAECLADPLLVGELSGAMPDGFHMTNSPADLAARTDVHRPMVLLSTSGTRLVCNAGGITDVYVSCLRNLRAQIDHLVRHHATVALIGAGSRDEFRDEDQLCCAWIAAGLCDAGYAPRDADTFALIERWRNASVEAITDGASANYLRRSDHLRDLDFIVSHVDDLDRVFRYDGEQVTALTAANAA